MLFKEQDSDLSKIQIIKVDVVVTKHQHSSVS